MNLDVVERTKIHNLRNSSKDDSKPDSFDWEFGIISLSYRAPQIYIMYIHANTGLKATVVTTTVDNGCVFRQLFLFLHKLCLRQHSLQQIRLQQQSFKTLRSNVTGNSCHTAVNVDEIPKRQKWFTSYIQINYVSKRLCSSSRHTWINDFIVLIKDNMYAWSLAFDVTRCCVSDVRHRWDPAVVSRVEFCQVLAENTQV